MDRLDRSFDQDSFNIIERPIKSKGQSKRLSEPDLAIIGGALPSK